MKLDAAWIEEQARKASAAEDDLPAGALNHRPGRQKNIVTFDLSDPNIITLEFVPTEDREITCIVCGDDGCELEAVAYKIARWSGKSRVWIGKHTGCELRPAAPWPREEEEP